MFPAITSDGDVKTPAGPGVTVTTAIAPDRYQITTHACGEATDSRVSTLSSIRHPEPWSCRSSFRFVPRT